MGPRSSIFPCFVFPLAALTGGAPTAQLPALAASGVGPALKPLLMLKDHATTSPPRSASSDAAEASHALPAAAHTHPETDQPRSFHPDLPQACTDPVVLSPPPSDVPLSGRGLSDLVLRAAGGEKLRLAPGVEIKSLPQELFRSSPDPSLPPFLRRFLRRWFLRKFLRRWLLHHCHSGGGSSGGVPVLLGASSGGAGAPNGGAAGAPQSGPTSPVVAPHSSVESVEVPPEPHTPANAASSSSCCQQSGDLLVDGAHDTAVGRISNQKEGDSTAGGDHHSPSSLLAGGSSSPVAEDSPEWCPSAESPAGEVIPGRAGDCPARPRTHSDAWSLGAGESVHSLTLSSRASSCSPARRPRSGAAPSPSLSPDHAPSPDHELTIAQVGGRFVRPNPFSYVTNSRTATVAPAE